MEIFDISRSLRAALASWPGDTRFHFALRWQMAAGASVNVGALESSVHNGTHADAPFHFAPDGPAIDALPLHPYLGACVVADVRGLELIEPAQLESWKSALEGAPRLLLKTDRWKEDETFPATIPVIAASVPAWLQARGVKLLGLDLPSVDAIDSKDLPNHHSLAQSGIAILESLDLAAIAPGVYELAALPLKIAGADGAPVRAILWRA